MRKKRVVFTLSLALCLFVVSACNNSSTVPTPVSQVPVETSVESPSAEPITDLVIYTDGVPWSIGDMMSRAIGDGIETLYSVRVIQKNVSGGSGANVLTEMMNAKDICIVHHTCSLPLTWLAGQSPYSRDEIADVAPISIDYPIIFTRPESPFDTWEELVEYAKANPGELTWGGTGVKGSMQLVHQLVTDDLGIDIEYIPYDSGANVRVGVLSGDVDIGSVTAGNILNDTAEGVYKAFFTSNSERFEGLPDLRTAAEVGVLSLDGNGVWRAFFSPAGYDQEITDFISEMIENVKATTEWADFAKTNNLYSFDMSHDEFEAYVRDYMDLCAPAIANMD